MKSEVIENNTKDRKKIGKTTFYINRVYKEDSNNSLADLVEKTAINDIEVGNDKIVTKNAENA
ncbi:hypothetical protein HB943_12985 [Listeria weihenstephanensis]|uniref:Uncharacterized protein n=1 Tax=Listeria weihenstephanensis TaxID=1006155 RepID=A0A841Z6B0_9LIST|nr:hypothetical protein [Listeria weihenstephanensis]MBC1501521.1 hypothetical protein [Listeria weihenstephanensis]